MVERFGDYELIRHIATGGMAEIFIARHSTGGLDRVVVIKRMLPELAVRPDFVQMFLDEARLTASLQHPHVVRVHDLGQVDGSYFIAMELVDGPHLGALFAHSLRARRPLPIELCAWIVARAADGLHYAHDVHDPATGNALDLVHRDISPQNILVSKNGEVKVTDFGVAKASTQQTKTRTGIVKGKVSYMSPEQCLGEQVDRRTDVFALGIVLYELLTRRRLFRDKSDLLIMQRITAEDVAAPSTVNPNVNAELDAILGSALARDRDKRFATANEFAVALDGWLRDNKRPADELSMQTWFAANCAELAATASMPLPEQTVTAPFSMPSRASSTSATPSFSSRLAVQESHTLLVDDDNHNRVSPIIDEPTAISLPPRFDGGRAGVPSKPGDQSLLVEPPSTMPEFSPPTELPAPTPSGRFPPVRPTPSGKFKPTAASMSSGTFPTQRTPSGTFTPVTSTSNAVLPATRSRNMLWAAGGGLAAVVLLIGLGVVLRATPPPSASSTATTPLPPVATAQAALVVTTVPEGATITVGDRIVGKAPVRLPLGAGKVVVQAQFPEQPPQSRDVEVPASGDAPVHFEARVPLLVTSTPSNAKVRVNGDLIGETPFDRGFLVEPGVDLDIRVDPPVGYVAWQQTHKATPGQPLAVDAVLQAKERAAAKVVDEGKGALSVRTEPWTLVRLDKDIIGETPFAERPVKAGKHTLIVKNPDVGLDDKIVITVPKDKTIAVILKYEKVGGTWKLASKTIR